MNTTYLSYLMGAEKISNQDLTNLGINIVEKTDSESRKLKIPSEKIEGYKSLIREKITAGFWSQPPTSLRSGHEGEGQG